MLSERAQSLLKILVERYIAEGQPVGSRALSRFSSLELSPATIRNVMADLEEMGFVASPHTSAGRVPTPKGYRFFVDTLLTVRPMEELERQQIADQISPDDPHRVHDRLQGGGAPLIAAGQPGDLLGERHLRTERVLAVQPPHLQVYAQRPATDRLVGDVTHVRTMHPLRYLRASRAGSRPIPGHGSDHHNTVLDHDRYDIHDGQLRKQQNQGSTITRHQRSHRRPPHTSTDTPPPPFATTRYENLV